MVGVFVRGRVFHSHSHHHWGLQISWKVLEENLLKRVSSPEILSRERPIHLKSIHQNTIYKWPIHVICQIFLLTTKFSWNAWKTNLLQVKLVKLNCWTSSSPKYQFITTLCYEVYISSINGKMGKGCVDRQFTEGKVLLATEHKGPPFVPCIPQSSLASSMEVPDSTCTHFYCTAAEEMLVMK